MASEIYVQCFDYFNFFSNIMSNINFNINFSSLRKKIKVETFANIVLPGKILPFAADNAFRTLLNALKNKTNAGWKRKTQNQSSFFIKNSSRHREHKDQEFLMSLFKIFLKLDYGQNRVRVINVFWTLIGTLIEKLLDPNSPKSCMICSLICVYGRN